jgi:hypothetical protein
VQKNSFLVIAAICSGLAALLHLGCIVLLASRARSYGLLFNLLNPIRPGKHGLSWCWGSLSKYGIPTH